ncbi:MAG TPA: Ig-like domain-containing protein, partial [Thermoplasmata archaeon]|nr:Ig-like domain-containing protein [Thermoplasmata archaeon]
SGTTLTWSHSSPFSQSTDYTVSVGKSAKSSAGVEMGSDFSFSFRTNSSPPPPGPKIISVSPANGSTGMGLRTGFRIEFSEPMDIGSLTSATGVVPPFNYATANRSETVYSWTPYMDLPGNTTFFAGVEGSARSLAGIPLGTGQWFEFTTQWAAPAAPRVVSTLPRNGATGVAVNTSVSIEFNVDMDPSSLVAEFAIFPPVPGGQLFPGPRRLIFDHGSLFALDTTYSVSLNGSLRSTAGVAMGSDFNLVFYTGSGPPTFPVSGRVSDENGNAVPGATVNARRTNDDKVVSSTMTDASGDYRFDLPTGWSFYIEVIYPDGSKERSEDFILSAPKSQSFQKGGGSTPGGATAALLAAGIGATILIAVLVAFLVLRMRRAREPKSASPVSQSSPPVDEETIRAAKELEERAKRAEAARRAVEKMKERPGGPG